MSEQEVREVNFIIKSRALKYIGAAKEEWLYPEKFVSKSEWNTYGKGYLRMPDPTPISLGGTVVVGGKRGSMAMDEYGRRPWQKDRFQSEFAKIMGPYRRGRAADFGKLEAEKDTEGMHQYFLTVGDKYK